MQAHKYNVGRVFKDWLLEHCIMVLVGLFIDIVNGTGPLLTVPLAGVGFARLFLKLLENNEPQLWTWPNLITATRICGVVWVGLAPLHNENAGTSTLSDEHCALLGILFATLGFIEGWLARKLQQTTNLGARTMNSQADALGTAFLALTLHTKNRMTAPLAVHMAAAAYVLPLAKMVVENSRAASSRRKRVLGIAEPQTRVVTTEPWARTFAGAMFLFAVLAVALPGIAMVVEVPAAIESGSLKEAALTCGNIAGLVNLVSFGLSYLLLAGVKVLGTEVIDEGSDSENESTNGSDNGSGSTAA